MDTAYLEPILLIAGTMLVVWVISYSLRKAIDFFIKRNSSQILADPTNFIFLKNSISFIAFSIGLFWIFTKIPYFNSLGNALFASAGVFAAFLGFASQKAFSNIIGGIFILVFKPFRIGDIIEAANGRKGVVEEITLRHTVLKDYEFKRIIIPNSIISDDTIVNSSIIDRKIRKHIDINISYESNLEKAESIIRKIVAAHPFFLDDRTNEQKEQGVDEVQVRVISLAESGVMLRAFVWAKDFDDAIEIERATLRSVKLAFDQEGIEIPYPHRTIVYKNKPMP